MSKMKATTIILVVIVICGFYWIFNQSKEDTAVDKVTDEIFQQEVLQSSIPVIVIFCTDELWDRKSVPWSLKQPASVIFEIKEIVEDVPLTVEIQVADPTLIGIIRDEKERRSAMKHDTQKPVKRRGVWEGNIFPSSTRFQIEIDTRKTLLEMGFDAALQEMTQQFLADVEQLCGVRYQHRKDRKAFRWGTTGGEVVLGGRKIAITRPLVVTRWKGRYRELKLPSYEHFKSEDPLTERILEQILVGVSMRHYPRSLEGDSLPFPLRGLSKSAISRRFVLKTWEMIGAWLSRRLDELDLVVLYVDGIVLGDHTVVCALGVDREGEEACLRALGGFDGESGGLSGLSGQSSGAGFEV